jgi:hypothetical protein
MASCETCKYQSKTEHEEPCKGCTHNATDNYEPMTNADRIRSMSDEELAEFLLSDDYYIDCTNCKEPENEYGTCIGRCENELLRWLKSEEWLKSEVEDDTRTSN